MLRKVWSYPLLASLTLAMLPIAGAEEPQMQLPEPTNEHKLLAHSVGTWDAKVKTWPTPDADPIEWEAVETVKTFGKFWVVNEFKGSFGGMEYEGRGRTGYDPVAKKYVGTWFDTMSPYMTTMEGTYDEKTNTLTMTTEGRDCYTNKIVKGKVVSTYIDANTMKFEMHGPGTDGKLFKMMQIDYTRQKK